MHIYMLTTDCSKSKAVSNSGNTSGHNWIQLVWLYKHFFSNPSFLLFLIIDSIDLVMWKYRNSSVWTKPEQTCHQGNIDQYLKISNLDMKYFTFVLFEAICFICCQLCIKCIYECNLCVLPQHYELNNIIID